MSLKPKICLFVAGTDTGVGKTVVSSGLTRIAANRGFKTIGIKPVETGCEEKNGALFPPDGFALYRAARMAFDLDACCPFRFRLPASPFRASAMENKRLKIDDMVRSIEQSAKEAEVVILEGAGGLLVPINESEFMIDLIEHLGFPTILVGRTRLGAINHVMLSVEALKSRNIQINGVILSHSNQEFGPEELHTPGDLRRLLPNIPILVLNHIAESQADDPQMIAEMMKNNWNGALEKLVGMGDQDET